MGHLRQSTLREARDPVVRPLPRSRSPSRSSRRPTSRGSRSRSAARRSRLVPDDIVLAGPRGRARRAARPDAHLPAPRGRPDGRRGSPSPRSSLGTGLANGARRVRLGRQARHRSASLLVGAIVLIDSTDRLWVVVAAARRRHGRGGRLGPRRASPSIRATGRRRSSASTISPRSRPRRSSSASRRSIAATASPVCRSSPAIVGCLGIVLGAALASLLGLYLAAAALIAIAALARVAAAPLGRDHRARRRGADGRDVRAPKRRARVPAAVVRSGRERAARPVRGQLEPAADLRVHRRPHLPRASRPRHRLVGRAAARGVRALPPGRASTLPRSAAALLPARRQALHPPADLRPGRLRARHRRARAAARARS